MPDSYHYAAIIERDQHRRLVVPFSGFGWGATDGATRDEVLAEAPHLLREFIVATVRESGAPRDPSPVGKRWPLLVSPVQTAFKAAL